MRRVLVPNIGHSPGGEPDRKSAAVHETEVSASCLHTNGKRRFISRNGFGRTRCRIQSSTFIMLPGRTAEVRLSQERFATHSSSQSPRMANLYDQIPRCYATTLVPLQPVILIPLRIQ